MISGETNIGKQKRSKKIIKWVFIGIAISLLIILYKFYSPYKYHIFPSCPFYYITGLKCPGCGSQRAIHYLLNFDIIDAFKENMLLVIAIPYLILGAYFDLITLKTEKQLRIRKMLFGSKAIIIILIIVIGYWILRNIPF
jgi:hypothetical protein